MSCDFLNLIGAANIRAVPTKMCHVTPYVFFLPLPPFARACGIAHTEKDVWLARLVSTQVYTCICVSGKTLRVQSNRHVQYGSDTRLRLRLRFDCAYASF